MCEHCEEEPQEKNKIKLLIIPILLCISAFFQNDEILRTVLFTAAYLLAGYDIIAVSIKNVIKGNFFDENFLMSSASIGAMLLKDYPEAISVMVLYKIGEYLQDKALDNSRNSIKALTDIAPKYANVEQNGKITQISPQEVKEGAIIVVKAGEKVPLDGIIIEGEASINMSSLTGESTEKILSKGENILSGSINTNGLLKIRVTKSYNESTVSKILELIENAQAKKSKTENFITKFAKYYTPCVVLIAFLIALVPLLFHLNANIWIERALTFLVISCPCALVISIPLTFFCAIGTASKQGILIKGSSYIEKLAQTGTIAFDKTGTLTKGSFAVTEIKSYSGESEEEIIKFAAYAEYYSNHPIANAIKNKYNKNYDTAQISSVKELAGKGITAEICGNEIILGNKKLIKEYGFDINDDINSTTVYLLKNKLLAGAISIEDEIKQETCPLISKLKELKIKTVMLTGDSFQGAEKIAKAAGIDEFYANLLPQDKVEKIEKLICENGKRSTIFAGDGINDAPVLTRSDAGIAMGALGSDAAIEAADIVIQDDNISKIYSLILIAKKTMRIAKQNIILAIGVKILFLILSVFGYMTMWGAIFADVGVALLAVMNAMRCTKYKNNYII